MGISNKLMKDSKVDLLMNRWRFPTLSLHGIEGRQAGGPSKELYLVSHGTTYEYKSWFC